MTAVNHSDPRSRVTVSGKFFRLGAERFFARGVTYGPFAPCADTGHFASQEQTKRDFRQIHELGANLLRVYYVPPPWWLDLAEAHGLKVFVDVPWHKHLCFLDTRQSREEARHIVRQAARDCHGHPAIFALSVVNEIPPEIVRWSGIKRVERFVDELIAEVKHVDAQRLCTFTNYPPTEFLQPQTVDFHSFNVYLHDQRTYRAYLARLQMIADTKPLLLAEVGMDSLREGEANKCSFLAWQIELAARGGLAGTVLFSFTDDWFRGGAQIEDWAFGLTTRDRQPKDSYFVVHDYFRRTPCFPLPRTPKVSVVVASYNGARTLTACLESLQNLNYPDYEVILVDDGSTDETPEIARRFPSVRNIRQINLGLSAARNAGIAAAKGEIVAFTDSDCRADEDWLHYLVGDLLDSEFAGIGGHNFLPPDDSPVAAAVMASPGGPAHVMLTDREAEHIPGCNMAFYKWALEAVGGFDPVFRKAGDDVDVCWRLQEQGYKIGFSPAGFVWHYRRSTIKAYLRQQAGYGEAEALLARKHPEYFNSLGGSIWRGRIYAATRTGVVLGRAVIYHGIFGSGFFQKLYASGPSSAIMLCTSLEYYVLVATPLLVASVILPDVRLLALVSLLLPVSVCGIAAAQSALPESKWRVWSRPLVGLLYFLQPLERGLARYRSSLQAHATPPLTSHRKLPQLKFSLGAAMDSFCYWSDGSVDRYALLKRLWQRIEREQWPIKLDTGWADYDAEFLPSRWVRLQLITTSEQLDQGRLNLRFRLATYWSLPAKILFWGLLGLEAVLASLIGPSQPWIWMILISLPVLNLYFDYDQFRCRQQLAALLAEISAGLNLAEVENRPR